MFHHAIKHEISTLHFIHQQVFKMIWQKIVIVFSSAFKIRATFMISKQDKSN